MKRRFVYLAIAMLFAGCSADPVENFKDGCSEEPAQILPRNLNEAVFHEGAGAWMIPRPDPYTLANFQRALDNLSSGKSTQILTRARADEFSGTPELKATHYALRIFPKNENEQWAIELMEDVKVACLPFDHTQLTQQEVENLPAVKTRSGDGDPEADESAIFPESYRYTVTYTDLQTTDGPKPDETYILPILYAVWPVGKPLPDDIEYEFDYEVFLPRCEELQTRASGLSEEALQVLEAEAVSLALGITIPKRIETRSTQIMLRGKVEYLDKFLNEKVLQQGLKQRIQSGSFIYEVYTSKSGEFSLASFQTLILYFIDANATYSHVFQHSKWKITCGDNTSPFTVNWGTVGKYWPNPETVARTCPISGLPAYEINIAASHYYLQNSYIAADHVKPITIRAYPEEGRSYFYPSDNPYIV